MLIYYLNTFYNETVPQWHILRVRVLRVCMMPFAHRPVYSSCCHKPNLSEIIK